MRKIGEIASSLDITTGQLALAWILRRSEISAALVGATKPEHVIENAGASDVTLSKDVLGQLDEILDNKPEWPPTYGPNIYYEDKMGYR
ncbi:MAG: aldo/keto reductase [Candidatus Thorarchaeota archaeon]